MKSFNPLNLLPTILKAIENEGYTEPTPIQIQAIPKILERQDILACAQTGTGKTAAFALPMLQLFSQDLENNPTKNQQKKIKALILTPTRELASQIGESFTHYGAGLNINNTVIFGGVKQKAQVRAIQNGVDIVIATPGRLLDLLNQRLISFSGLEVFVLDEADRMLDMGFVKDVRRIISIIPKKRQTLFFSATMPPEINKLAAQILTNPVRIHVTPPATTAERILQQVYFVDKKKKSSLLIQLLQDQSISRALVFTRTKRDANRVSESLMKAKIKADAIHGNKSQNAREYALERIKSGDTRVLVATDIAARGIDIDCVTHVFNYDIPNVPESYVHRIGRTARAGNEGIAISLCSQDERGFFTRIERITRQKVPVSKTPDGLLTEMKKTSRFASPPKNPHQNNKKKPHASQTQSRNPDKKNTPQKPNRFKKKKKNPSRSGNRFLVI